MRLDQIGSIAFGMIFKRILLRAGLVALIALLALIAVYHFTVAGTLALEAQFGVVYARLMVAGVYTALAAVPFGILWATRGKAAKAPAPALPATAEAKVAMLVEAAMLGYNLARKGERAR